IRCNCSLCKKARAWFAFVGGSEFRLLKGEDHMSTYEWTPSGREAPGLTYRFCSTCGARLFATGDVEFMGGRFHALAVATFDNASIDQLAGVPLKFHGWAVGAAIPEGVPAPANCCRRRRTGSAFVLTAAAAACPYRPRRAMRGAGGPRCRSRRSGRAA